VKYDCRFCKTKSASEKQEAANLATVCDESLDIFAIKRAACAETVAQNTQ
jgi:hypothetical protein